MDTALRTVDSWLRATVDVVLAVFALGLAWYPALSIGNAVVGTPLEASTVTFLVVVLSLGSAYPFVAGDWSLGRLGEFVFALVAAAFAWGVVGMFVVLASGIELSGSDPRPQATLWLVAYGSAFGVVHVASPLFE